MRIEELGSGAKKQGSGIRVQGLGVRGQVVGRASPPAAFEAQAGKPVSPTERVLCGRALPAVFPLVPKLHLGTSLWPKLCLGKGKVCAQAGSQAQLGNQGID